MKLRTVHLNLFLGAALLFPSVINAAPISVYTPFGDWQSTLGGGHDNVLFNNPGNYPLNVVTNPTSPFTVTGHINGTTGVGTFPTNGLYVDISGTEQLFGGPGGQADVEPADGGTSNLTITPNPANGLTGFNAVAFKIEYPNDGNALSIEVFYGGLSVGSNTFNVTQKMNEFWGFIADPDFFITRIDINSLSGDFHHLQQIRVQHTGRDPIIGSTGEEGQADGAVPEPATIAVLGMILAMCAGCYFYTRRSHRAAANVTV